MPLKKIPDELRAVKLPAYRADQTFRQILRAIGPGVTAAFHTIDNDFDPALAITIADFLDDALVIRIFVDHVLDRKSVV